MKQIYVSPHADDAALSCGGQIIANPARRDEVAILNMFTSQREAAEGQDKGALALFDSVNAERTTEDEAAWDSIGVQCIHARLPEALLRKRFPFRLAGRGDGQIVESVCQVIREQARANPGAAFHFPAGFGSHVDHLACKAAAFRLLDDGSLDRVFLYEDVPYSWLRFIRRAYYGELLRDVDIDSASAAHASRPDGESLLGYLRGKAVPFPRGKKLFPLVYASLLGRSASSRSKGYVGRVTTVPLTEQQLAEKQALLRHYASQIPMLFGAEPDAVFRRLHSQASSEVTIEIRKRPQA